MGKFLNKIWKKKGRRRKLYTVDIDRCDQCYHIDWDTPKCRCLHPNGGKREVDWTEDIPDWCPLPDSKNLIDQRPGGIAAVCKECEIMYYNIDFPIGTLAIDQVCKKCGGELNSY